MERLKMPSVGSQDLVPSSGKPLPTKSVTLSTLPPIVNRVTDVEIPRSVWSSWKQDGHPRALRRPLSDEERQALELRRDEIAPALAPHNDRDVNRIALALTDMFGGFPSMRMRDDSAVIARIDGARRILAKFPAWAIEKACNYIQTNGVWRDGSFERQWPPSDSEIVSEVSAKLRLYGDTYNSAVALLAAEIEA